MYNIKYFVKKVKKISKIFSKHIFGLMVTLSRSSAGRLSRHSDTMCLGTFCKRLLRDIQSVSQFDKNIYRQLEVLQNKFPVKILNEIC